MQIFSYKYPKLCRPKNGTWRVNTPIEAMAMTTFKSHSSGLGFRLCPVTLSLNVRLNYYTPHGSILNYCYFVINCNTSKYLHCLI